MKKFSYFLTLLLMLSISEIVFSQCVTNYTSFSAGDFADGANWIGGIAPPNPIPPGVTVTMDHEMINNGTLENNGTLIASVGSFTNNIGAMYRGRGSLSGNFINNGTFSPGSTMVVAQLVTAPVTAITGTTATSGGSICYDGGSAITAKGVCWSTSPLPTIALPTKTSDGMGTGTFTSSITGLTERTTYYVRAYATNSVGTAYGNEVSFTTNCGPVTFTYNGSSVTYGTVLSAGRCWLDRNLGAAQVATSSTDAASYGDLFQWGRGADGHQVRSPLSGTINIQSTMDSPGHDDFIIGFFDWRSPQNNDLWQGVSGINNPCPSGYRLPTEAELNAERLSWSSNKAAGAFASPLKLPMAGYRDYGAGSLINVGTEGWYWGSTVSGANPRSLYFTSSDASMYTDDPAFGVSVRCLKDDSPVGAIGSLDCDGATNTGTLVSGVAASGVSSSVSYTGGNSGSHAGQTVTSTGVTGLTAYLYPGVFATGAGSLVYTITGTPASAGTASFALNIGGQTCTLTRTVAAPSFVCGDVLNYGGEDYNTVMIGTQCWMAENLNIGDVTAVGDNMTDNSIIEKYCNNCATYGGLYQWGEAVQYLNGASNTTSPSPAFSGNIQGICPTGWHLPTDAEWTTLETALPSPDKGSRLAGNAVLWYDGALDMSAHFGTSGFVALPAGIRIADGSFFYQSLFAVFWSSSESGSSDAWIRVILYDDTDVNQFSDVKANGFSVRCVQD